MLRVALAVVLSIGVLSDTGAARIAAQKPSERFVVGSLLAEAASQQLDSRPGRQRRRRQARTTCWIVHRPGTLTDREIGATQNPPWSKCCRPAPPVLVFDRDGNLVRSWGGPGQKVRLAGVGARHPRRRQRFRLARRKRAEGQPAAEVHARRPSGHADWEGGPERGQRRHEEPGKAGGHRRGREGPRSVRRRRVREPSGHRLRHRNRGLQAALGRVRQAAERRSAARLQARSAAFAAIRQSGALRRARGRWSRLRVRPDEQSLSGVPQGRHLRGRVLLRETDAAERLGVVARAVARPGSG